MPISESQLESWSHQGAVTSSATAYAAVKRAIESSAALSSHRVEVYLQGSYRNSTNIRGESDVDVVVHCDETFWWNIGRLGEPQKSQTKAYLDSLGPARYQWPEFRAHVLEAITSHFGTAACTNKNKCIKVTGAGGTGIDADVVPCFNHRLYYPDRTGEARLVEGMAFRTANDGRLVHNYPKQHYANGVEKHANTSETFKPVVRIFKNVKARLVELGRIEDDLAPSYFIECLLYNVQDDAFSGVGWQDAFKNVYGGIDEARFADYVCVNGVRSLFGLTPEQWTPERASEYLNQVVRLWNE